MTEPASAAGANGRGSVAQFGARLFAFVVDGALSVLVAVLAGFRPGTNGYGLVVYAAFLAIELVFITVAAQTPGMRAAGIVVVRAGDGGKPQLRWVALRTVLLAAVVPAVVADGTGRALHDRAAGLTMLRTR